MLSTNKDEDERLLFKQTCILYTDLNPKSHMMYNIAESKCKDI